jgi:hypothetical protein
LRRRNFKKKHDAVLNDLGGSKLNSKWAPWSLLYVTLASKISHSFGMWLLFYWSEQVKIILFLWTHSVLGVYSVWSKSDFSGYIPFPRAKFLYKQNLIKMNTKRILMAMELQKENVHYGMMMLQGWWSSFT